MGFRQKYFYWASVASHSCTPLSFLYKRPAGKLNLFLNCIFIWLSEKNIYIRLNKNLDKSKK